MTAADTNWDPSYLRELLGDENDKEFLELYLGTFEKRVFAALCELKTAVKDSDWTQASAAAHKLKGAAAGVGGTKAKDIAAFIESGIKKSNHPEGEILRLKAIFDTLTSELKKEFLDA